MSYTPSTEHLGSARLSNRRLEYASAASSTRPPATANYPPYDSPHRDAQRLKTDIPSSPSVRGVGVSSSSSPTAADLYGSPPPPPLSSPHDQTGAYIPVFDARRTLFATSPRVNAPSYQIQSPTTASAPSISPPPPAYDPNQVQQTVNDVAASRFAPFIPSSPHPATKQPVSVLVFDEMNVTVAGGAGSGTSPLQPAAERTLLPHQQQSNNDGSDVSTPQILGIEARRPHESQIYTFAQNGVDGSHAGPSIRPPPDSLESGRGAAGPQSPTHTGTGAPPVHKDALSAPTRTVQLEDLEAITFKIGGCFDLNPKVLLYGGWALLFLMLLFVAIAFGVSWSEGNPVS